MPQLIKPTTVVKVVPKEGELEITLNINITIDGKVVASADQAQEVTVLKTKEEEDKVQHIMPNFTSGLKLGTFGKTT